MVPTVALMLYDSKYHSFGTISTLYNNMTLSYNIEKSKLDDTAVLDSTINEYNF